MIKLPELFQDGEQSRGGRRGPEVKKNYNNLERAHSTATLARDMSGEGSHMVALVWSCGVVDDVTSWADQGLNLSNIGTLDLVRVSHGTRAAMRMPIGK